MRAVKARTGVFMVPLVRQDSWLLGAGLVTYEGCLEASSKRVVLHSNPLMFQRTSSQGARASSDRWRKLGSFVSSAA